MKSTRHTTLKNAKRLAAILALIVAYQTSSAGQGLDDALNYKPPQKIQASVQPYTQQEIIGLLVGAIDENGKYTSSTQSQGFQDLNNDPKIKAFNEENFGTCDAFYIFSYGTAGNGGMQSVLSYAFPETEGEKQNASIGIRLALNYLKDMNTTKGCKDKDQYITRIKGLFDSIIQSAPAIIQEKEILVRQQKEQEERQAIAKTQREKALEREAKAKEMAEENARIEKAKSLATCRKSSQYMQYVTASAVVRGKMIVQNAKVEMQRQKEGAKVSGLINNSVMQSLGVRIADANQFIKENFASYRQYGGLSKTPETLTAQEDPCQL